MFEKKKWHVSSAHTNEKGQRTTVTISTEDEKVVRQILQEPTAENAKAQKEDFMNAQFTTSSKRESKSQPKQLTDNRKTVKEELPKLNKNLKANLVPPKKEPTKLLSFPKKTSDTKSKRKLSRTVVTGKANIQHKSRNLNENQLGMSDHHSFDGNRGKLLKKAYEQKRKQIEFSGLSQSQKKKLLDKLYKLYSEILKYDSQYYSWMVSGPARYPSAKMEALSENIMEKNSIMYDWWQSIQPQLSHSTKSQEIISKENEQKKENRIKKIKEEFNLWYNRALSDVSNYKQRGLPMRYNPNVSMAQSWVNDALKVDMKLYKELFEKVNALADYSKNSNFYKTYLSVKNGEKTQEKLQKQNEEDNKIIYSCSDYIIRNIRIQAGQRVGIKFTFKPKPQLVYALKSRKYVWYSNEGMWICKPEKFDLEWAKSISSKYEKYL